MAVKLLKIQGPDVKVSRKRELEVGKQKHRGPIAGSKHDTSLEDLKKVMGKGLAVLWVIVIDKMRLTMVSPDVPVFETRDP